MFYAAFGSSAYFLVATTFCYYLKDNFLVAIGVNYSYEKVAVKGYLPYKSNTYGEDVFGQYMFKNLPYLVYVELEYVNMNVDFDTQFYDDLSITFINPYIGGGLKQRMGEY